MYYSVEYTKLVEDLKGMLIKAVGTDYGSIFYNELQNKFVTHNELDGEPLNTQTGYISLNEMMEDIVSMPYISKISYHKSLGDIARIVETSVLYILLINDLLLRPAHYEIIKYLYDDLINMEYENETDLLTLEFLNNSK